MATTPYRGTCTINGDDFDCLSISVVFSTKKDRAGMPLMGSLKSEVRCLVDFHDDENISHGSLKTLFDLANVVDRHKIMDMKVEFWQDESHHNALCSFSFKGWISNFQTLNPMQSLNGRGASDAVNHLLVLGLQPVLNEQNFADIRIGN
jgi:hypothetical protein